jgi:lipopolysaccharide export system protein LptA
MTSLIPKPVNKSLLLLLVAAVMSATQVVAQKPGEPERLEDGMGSQFDSGGSRTPVLKGPALPVLEVQPAPAVKKETGPTVIDALESTYNQETNLAVFIGEVVVKDPEFNVWCDKLTAHLIKAEQPKSADGGSGPKLCNPVASGGPAPRKAGGGGLERAIAEMNPGKRVVITQDKPQADGTIQHSVGTGDKATYNVKTGDIVLTGMPEVQQGDSRLIATSDHTKITLNRDGHMKADGTAKSVIIDKAHVGL